MTQSSLYGRRLSTTYLQGTLQATADIVYIGANTNLSWRVKLKTEGTCVNFTAVSLRWWSSLVGKFRVTAASINRNVLSKCPLKQRSF